MRMSLLAQSVLVALILVMIASTVGCGGAGSPGDISGALPVSLAEPTPTSQPDGVAVTSATPLPSESWSVRVEGCCVGDED